VRRVIFIICKPHAPRHRAQREHQAKERRNNAVIRERQENLFVVAGGVLPLFPAALASRPPGISASLLLLLLLMVVVVVAPPLPPLPLPSPHKPSPP
jgi:hypothetical protein